MKIELDVAIGPQGAMRRSEAFCRNLALSGDVCPLPSDPLCIASAARRNAQKPGRSHHNGDIIEAGQQFARATH
jgi:hypothetical protein